MIDEGILLDDKIPNYQSKLTINENYDFYQLLDALLYRQYSELCEKLEPLAQFTKNKKLKMNFKKDKNKNVQITLTSDKVLETWKDVFEPKDKKIKISV